MTVLEPIRKYIAELQAQGERTVRLDAILDATNLPRSAALRVLDKLAGEGYLEEASDSRAPKENQYGPAPRNPVWLILGGNSIADRPGHKKVYKKTGRDRMYSIIRMRRRVTGDEIKVLAGVNVSNIHMYMRVLERNGIIRRIGRKDGSILWLMIKDPGPNRPRLPERPS